MATASAALRRWPHPYRAILAICSDLDETPTRAVYEDTARFLNTAQTVAAMGQGVDLEVGNTIYFDMPQGQFSYRNTDDAGRARLHELMQSGHLDAFHSFGDHATTRAHAGRALDDLVRHDCRIGVWIDHAVAPSNFGADIMRGSGDVVGHEAYHADLTCGFGVRYVWRGRVTSVIGQDAPRSLQGVFDPRHPAASLRTVAKEWAKGALARAGNAKYDIHPANQVLRPATLRDGRQVFEFLRANPYWESVTTGETARGFAGVVTRRMLDTLVRRGGVQILYTHLGKIARLDEPLEAETRAALRLLRDYRDAGGILVTTTRRALDFARARREASAVVQVAAGTCEVALTVPTEWTEVSPDNPRSMLCGLTVHVPKAAAYRMLINGARYDGFAQNPADETGERSLSLPWPRLSWPA